MEAEYADKLGGEPTTNKDKAGITDRSMSKFRNRENGGLEKDREHYRDAYKTEHTDASKGRNKYEEETVNKGRWINDR